MFMNHYHYAFNRSFFLATCTYDKDQITTFDNSTYYVNLGDKYHILTQYIPKDRGFEENDNDEYFSIIVGQRSLQLLVI